MVIELIEAEDWDPPSVWRAIRFLITEATDRIVCDGHLCEPDELTWETSTLSPGFLVAITWVL